MKILAKAFVDKASIQEEGTLEAAVASTPVEDRHGETIDQEGWDFKNYKKNPIILWAHGLFNQPPIGKVEKIWLDGEGKSAKLMFKPRFDLNDSFAAEIFRKIKDGFLNAFSVGFMPIEQDGPHYIKQELLEISAVNVPANPEARVILRTADGVECPETNFEELQKIVAKQEELVIKPYPNEHACRVEDPGKFQEGSFRSMERDHEGKKYRVIMGRLKGETTLTEQSYRYPKDTWSVDQARGHCRSHDGTFEAASGEGSACALGKMEVEVKIGAEEAKAIIQQAITEFKAEKKKQSEEERRNLMEALKLVNQSTAHLLGMLKADNRPAEKANGGVKEIK